MKILLIEDSTEIAEAVGICFQLLLPEAVVSIATDGTKGLEMLRSESCDVVILDLNLPDIDGFDALKELRSFSKVPVVILTVRGEEANQARGLELGGNDYIIKPFKPKDLIDRIKAVLKSHE